MHAQYQPGGVSVAAPTASTVRTGSVVREDLNGLRGIAIALVVVFHIWMGRVSGGVDVFLVLTGFFFTASLIRSAQSGGSLNPITRVTRILRRLGPPLVLVLVGVAVATALLLPRTRWVDIGNQLVSGLLFYANWELAWTSQDYLAADPTVSPLQHLWSVAVQFQFYLVAVGVVFGLAWIVRRSRGGVRTSPPPRLYLLIFAGASIMSFTYAADGTSRLQSWNYYDTGARLWEIMLGGAVAAYYAALPSRRAPRTDWAPRAGRAALATAGLLAVVSCGFLFDGVNEFPGPWALFPVLATLALVVAGPDTPVAHLLRTRFGLWLGSIAFPLYLWHWPVLIFVLAYTGEPTADLTTGMLIVAASVLLAMLTVRLVEKPMNLPPRSLPRIAVTATAATLAVVLVCSAVGWNQYVQKSVADLQANNAVDRYTHPGALELTDGVVVPAAELSPSLLSAPDDIPAAALDGCVADFETEDPISCQYGDLDADRFMVLAGGSHAEHWIDALDLLGKEHGFRISTYLKMGCPLMVEYLSEYGDGDFSGCPVWSRSVLDSIASSQPDFVFTTSTRPREDGAGDYTPDWYVDVWAELASKGIPVLAMRDNPWLEQDGLAFRAIDCLSDGGSATSCGVRRSQALDTINPTLAASFRLPTVLPLDLTNALCDGQVCRAIEGNVLIYRDEHHLTATYMRTLTSELGRQIAEQTAWW